MTDPFIYIDEPFQWDDFIEHVAQADQLAIDLESNGMFAYRESICLMQISTRTRDYIIDPFAPFDWTKFGDLIEDPTVEKVFHASEYDLILMKEIHGWSLQNMFDTMWAVRILGHEKVGLANVLNHYFGIEITKKYQRTNWGERPLSDDQLAYARNDTHHLLRLRDTLAAELETNGCIEEAYEIFEEQADVRVPDKSFNPDNVWSVNGFRDLTGREKAIAREIYIYRDFEAEQQDRPHFKIFGNDAIMAIAEAMPRSQKDLQYVRGLTSRFVRRYGRGIMQAVQHGQTAKVPKRPRNPRPDDIILERYDRIQNWRKTRANERGVSSDVIMAKGTMWELARNNPQSLDALDNIESLGSWRRKTYGDELIALLT